MLNQSLKKKKVKRFGNGKAEREPGILKFGGGFLLDTENDVIGAADADGGVALANSFEGVLNLEEMTIG